MMDDAVATAWQEDAAHILASLPNPVFLLDGEDRFIFLNHAAEMFFDSSEAMLRGTALDAQIPADSSLLALLARSRKQMASVADQGIEVASPRIGLKLLNVQIAPFGDRRTHDARMLVTLQERALAERLRGQSMFHGRRGRFRQWRHFWRMRLRTRLPGSRGRRSCFRPTCPRKTRNSPA